jgi:uncharacterized protein YkwD
VRTLLRSALVAGLLVLAVTAASLVSASAPVSATTRAQLERQFIAKVNHARSAHGLRLVHRRAGLTRYARHHSRLMAGAGYLYHTSNFNVICCWRSIGENVGYGPSVYAVNYAFMHSPEHRANILHRGWHGVGVGVYRSGGRIWVTEIFRQPW